MIADHRRRLLLYSFGFLLAALPAAASAQAWIGQVIGNTMSNQQARRDAVACMSGIPMAYSEVQEARTPASATMQSYWADVAAGTPTDVASHFHPGKSSLWSIDGGSMHSIAASAIVTDPFAGPDRRLADAPTSFFRAGDGATARGQWQLLQTNGRLLGTYDALFTRKQGNWLLSSLRLIPRETFVAPLAQYCHEVGDVLPYLLSSSEANRLTLAKRAEAAEAEAARAAEAAANEGTSSAKKRAVKAAETARRHRNDLAGAEAVVEGAKADAAAAFEIEATARAAHLAMMAAESTP